MSVARNPVPRDLATRRERSRLLQVCRWFRNREDGAEGSRAADVDALISAVRTERDRAMIEAMLLGGLRRS
jgi:integrase/recombinase XerD